MDTKNNFNDWFGTYRSQAPRIAFQNLATDLRERISVKRVAYHQARRRVEGDQANATLVKPGRRRLQLTLTGLVQHMQARRARAKAQQELRILVPLYRRVTAAIQQWTPGTDAPIAALDAAVWLLPLTTPMHRRHSVLNNVPEHMLKWVYGDIVEQDLANDIARQHQLVFFRPTVDEPSTAGTPCAAYTDLYRKIVTALELTSEEKSILAGALKVIA